ncbi:DUF302 domain-containing protein [Bacteroides sedimenti]|uniref:DUF302 domain-containing protein n=1 Tax=Bacteroides sedimenti TaxID=2136147 RepID=A0ABN6Z4A9_9BACE
MKYYISKILNVSFEEAQSKVVESLKNEGFGVLSEINIHDKLKEKLNIDFRRYKILGACNPAFAYKALQVEDKIGTMLPCNVIIQELAIDKIEVAAVDPVASMLAIENPELEKIAANVQEKLKHAVSSL